MKKAVTIMIVIYLLFAGAIFGIGKYTELKAKSNQEEYAERERQNQGTAIIAPAVTTPAPTSSPATAPAPTPVTTPKASTSPTPSTPTTPTTPTKTTLNAAEVAKHSSTSDCWIILSNVVYNITPYIKSHSGGASHIQCGTDQTTALQNYHKTKFDSFFAPYKVGAIGSQI